MKAWERLTWMINAILQVVRAAYFVQLWPERYASIYLSILIYINIVALLLIRWQRDKHMRLSDASFLSEYSSSSG